jgi:hypothetical protein
MAPVRVTPTCRKTHITSGSVYGEPLTRTEPVKGSSNRAFGWVFTAVFLIVAVWPLASGNALRWWALIVSGLLLLITLAAPALLTIPNRLWTRFGLLLHRIVSPDVLAILFYVVITPRWRTIFCKACSSKRAC